MRPATVAVGVHDSSAREVPAGHRHSFDRTAPLELERGPVEPNASATGLVRSLSYASPRGGRVPALLVTPQGDEPRPAVLFLHHGGRQTTWQFLQEAGELAGAGMASLFVDAPWLRPGHRGHPHAANAYRWFEQAGVDLLRAVQVLAALPDVDGTRLAYVGHGFGAHLGALLAAEADVRAVVLMAGSPSLSRAMVQDEHPFWKQGGATDAAELQAAAAQMASLDAERYIGRSQVPVFHQFASADGFVSYEMAHDYFAITPDPRVIRFYEADHGLNERARADRRAFLQQVLPAAPPAPPARAPEKAEPGRTSEELSVRLPLHYPAPPADTYRVLADRIYRTVSGHAYPLDVYLPADAEGPRPAVVLVHGQAHPALLRDAKDWPSLQGLARVIASRGMVAVVPNLGSSAVGPEAAQQFANVSVVADNVVAAVRHVQAHAVGLGADRRRMALWAAAEGGLYALGPVLGGELNGAVRCAVALYPELTDGRLLRTQPPLLPSVIERLRVAARLGQAHRPRLPILVVRAGHDRPEINDALDAFVEIARHAEAPVTLVRHDRGHRGFETVDATAATEAVIDRALAFLERNLQLS
jgi:dienelactone hydrolase